MVNLSQNAMSNNDEVILRGRYKIGNRKGRGTFGVTYEAIDLELPQEHKCIVKHLQPNSLDRKVIEIATRFFQEESEHLYKLGKHDRIPCLYARFQEGDRFYLVQEFIDGNNLEQEIGLDKLWDEKTTINNLKSILEVLDFVHKNNVIHRDIKPDNIIRRKKDEQLILIDFGAVKKISNTTIDLEGKPCQSVCIGTPYMPEEQRNGFPVLASDIYAVGIVAIMGLTGYIDIVEWHRNIEISDKLLTIINKMIAPEARDRYQNAGEALEIINQTFPASTLILKTPEETLENDNATIPANNVELLEPKKTFSQRFNQWWNTGVL